MKDKTKTILNDNINAYFKMQKQISKLEDIKKQIKLDIITSFDDLGINEFTTNSNLKGLRFYSEQKLIDTSKYYKLVNQKQFFETTKVINTKAKNLVASDRLDKITSVSLVEKLTVK